MVWQGCTLFKTKSAGVVLQTRERGSVKRSEVEAIDSNIAFARLPQPQQSAQSDRGRDGSDDGMRSTAAFQLMPFAASAGQGEKHWRP